MIDEKKLIEEMAEEIENCYGRKTELSQKARGYLNQPKSDNWIPCSERLPEESLDSVIGWDEHRKRCCFVQYYGGKWVLGNDIDSVKIIAWQPLPEPYKEA